MYFQIGIIFLLNYYQQPNKKNTKSRENVLQIQFGFYRHALQISYLSAMMMIACYWKSMYQELKEVNGWNVSVWSIMMKVH